MSQFRYERKFLIENLFKEEVALIIKKNPYLFKRKYHQRFVNNKYFDSLDYSLYNNHVIGKSDRYKIRVRWYDDLFGEIKKPILEIKSKNNYLGKKEYCNLDKFPVIQQVLEVLKVEWMMNKSTKIPSLTEIQKEVDDLLTPVNCGDEEVVIQKVYNVITAANVFFDLLSLKGYLLTYSFEVRISFVILNGYCWR